MLPVSSFVAEAYNRPPEVARIAFVSVTETAAEKLVALTRRTAMELAGLTREPDPALVRHIYDQHIMQGHIDTAQVVQLVRAIAATDAATFGNQYPAYRDDSPARRRRPSMPCARTRSTAGVMMTSYSEWYMGKERNSARQSPRLLVWPKKSGDDDRCH